MAKPYLGLVPYEESDAPYFFGRDTDQKVISANLKASRLTLLYGESGVGKSSVLRAAVVPYLRRDPETKVVVFHSWHSDPVAELVRNVRASFGVMQPPSRSLTRDLQLACEQATHNIDGNLLVILDQFEEYFQYHPDDTGEGTFVVEFPRVVNNNDLRVNFLISIREDLLASLDRFKGRIPNLFENYLRIRNLERKSAREAILRPIDQFNREHDKDSKKMTIQSALADRLIDDILKEKVAGDDRVEAPYLQLVMARWWEREMEAQSPELRYETLYELGGISHIYHEHLNSTMSTLATADQAAAAKIFRLMVSPSGRKQAQTVFDLANSTNLQGDIVKSILEVLRGARIVNPVVLPRTSSQTDMCYEFAHDVVAKAALEWQQEFVRKMRSRISAASPRRRYQVFISSTFDLRAERHAAIEAVLERGHIPIALEMFSPSSENWLRVVRTAMSESQVFLQILGHRYGSLVTGKEISFTELEYEIAQELGLIVLTFVLRDEEISHRRKDLNPNAAVDKIEMENFDRLKRFHNRVSQHFRRVWEGDPRSFKYIVELALADNLDRADKPGLIPEPYDVQILEAANNEFIVDIVRELQGFDELYARCIVNAEQKRVAARFFAEQYIDRILRSRVSLFFESSSTVAYVAKELSRFLSGGVKLDGLGVPTMQISTNNILAYLLLWLVAHVPCAPFPWGPPEETAYGRNMGVLGTILSRPPEYSGAPLDPSARWAIKQLLEQPFSLLALKRPTLLLGALSGLQLDKHHPKLPPGLSGSTKAELMGQLSGCFGPHAGTYRTKVFKRFLYATRLPIMIFLTADKIDTEIEIGKSHFVLDSELTWEDFCRNHPVAFCVGCTLEQRPQSILKFEKFGFRILQAHTYSIVTAFIARNQRFIEEFEVVTSVEEKTKPTLADPY